MNNSSPTISRAVSTRPKYQIYISSIGKLNDRDLSCHVKKDENKFLFEKKIPSLPKLLLRLFINIKKDSFYSILKFAGTKRNYQKNIFLPGAFLTNDIEAMRSYKQKLATTQADKYISMCIPVKRTQSVKLEKSFVIDTITHKDVDSTCLENRIKSSYYSKSIDNTKGGSKLKLSDIKVFEYDRTTSRSRASQSRAKKNIIHIKYSQTYLGSANTPQNNKTSERKPRSSTIKVKQFNTEDFIETSGVKKGQQTSRPTNHTSNTNQKYDMMVGGGGNRTSSHISKNRIKGMKTVRHFTGEEFSNIEMNC